MHDRLDITGEPAEQEFIERAARYRANGEWLTEHGAPWFGQFPGQYIAVSEGEVFVADDALEARRLASQKHPGDEPFAQYIPRENRPRVYGWWRRYAPLPKPLASAGERSLRVFSFRCVAKHCHASRLWRRPHRF